MQPDPFTVETGTPFTREAASTDATPRSPAVRLERRIDGKLWVETGGRTVAVEVVRCFPWASPERYLSLRDAAGEEVAFVCDAAELDLASRAALEASLVRSSFVLEITRILSVEEDFELRSWRVQTPGGVRTFQTPLDSWPRKLEGGGIVIDDVHGDVYRVTRPSTLDARSRKLLWAFVD